MHYQCPHCQARLGIFLAGPGRPRVEKGACPACGTKVVIGASPKRFAIVLPLLVLFIWMAWGMASPVLFGVLSGMVLWNTVMRLDKAPPA